VTYGTTYDRDIHTYIHTYIHIYIKFIANLSMCGSLRLAIIFFFQVIKIVVILVFEKSSLIRKLQATGLTAYLTK